MSAPTLTDLVDDALAVLAPGARLATLYHHPQVKALYASLPRYEAALAVAEAVDAHYPPYTEVPPVPFRGALFDFRDIRS